MSVNSETESETLRISCQYNYVLQQSYLCTYSEYLRYNFEAYLDIKVKNEEKATLQVFTKIICDELAVHPLVKDLGSCPSWRSISVIIRKQICAKHTMLMKNVSINLTRCHES
ncbi:hypothetical protein PHYBLDRAFT_173207 [Phycomyces blakesleeanus NRRL 1555(-)]|uniref:Uncharacterized protein n=1 Tax=Phycomyces blakesleeanus (strain ATCC 8743b / DSM 1359 / FGSC 10004 / NBRC 33097 / NRRL 1555) TaxID=763407 RepID=A0A162TPM1_PHYB8|nr:hypothetical protein PHYBLDRAFT_173207 [Phycomyces blakesleeanus NRRL 1555(-)]OAD68793.1 hypothetical protein PHYBLDRAFT_173207 [Phycomyces blakesleeanus NRRL 1555(-)]|eukprot:XP_018286833.1 hypothetical protein PHYBLDRAFT_173207 [Phycomyces blakesleeanus NRRL 1555(-)]